MKLASGNLDPDVSPKERRMTPHFHPALVNPAFGDPGLYLDFLFARRAILFDLGDLAPLGPRKLLRISHICITHTHIDHFIGFDRLLRIMLGRDKHITLYGPPGILMQVENRLASYSWNLIASYPTVFTLKVCELWPDGGGVAAQFSSQRAFARESEQPLAVQGGVILDEENLRIRVAFLDHSIPCLAFAFEEKQHVNFQKNRLIELGAPAGPWLSQLKTAVLRGEPDGTLLEVGDSPEGESRRTFTLGELKERVLKIVPGQKIAYVTDTAFTTENRRKIVELARGADYLFIEAVFLDIDRQRAADRAHLTARQAGELARAARVERVVPFHFSPRHPGAEEELRRELSEAFHGR